MLRKRLQKLSEDESLLSKEDFAKSKKELEQLVFILKKILIYILIIIRDYLANFKRTVVMHELFLSRLAEHSKFRQNNYFKAFLENSNVSKMHFF